MINNTESKRVYTVASGVTEYPIGFEFHYNPDGSPQLSAVIGHTVLTLNHNCKLSENKDALILIPTEEEAENLTGPDDYSWMDKWDTLHLVISREIPFVQESDYQLGRISAEQIEHDFDAAVMRDQILRDRIGDTNTDLKADINSLHSRIDFVQEEHLLDMAEVDSQLATKATKVELENAKTTLSAGLEGNAQAIQKTRDDMNAKDSELETILNSHASELTTLRGNQASLGDQVSGIEEKIPGTASATNPLVTKQQLLDEEMDIRKDLNEGLSEVQTITNDHAARLKTLRTDVDDLGDDVSDIQSKIPQSASGSNPLITKQQLLDEEMDIREDLNSGLSEVQTQITAQAAAIANKQDKLTAGENITIVDNVISSTGGGTAEVEPTYTHFVEPPPPEDIEDTQTISALGLVLPDELPDGGYDFNYMTYKNQPETYTDGKKVLSEAHFRVRFYKSGADLTGFAYRTNISTFTTDGEESAFYTSRFEDGTHVIISDALASFDEVYTLLNGEVVALPHNAMYAYSDMTNIYTGEKIPFKSVKLCQPPVLGPTTEWSDSTNTYHWPAIYRPKLVSIEFPGDYVGETVGTTDALPYFQLNQGSDTSTVKQLIVLISDAFGGGYDNNYVKFEIDINKFTYKTIDASGNYKNVDWEIRTDSTGWVSGQFVFIPSVAMSDLCQQGAFVVYVTVKDFGMATEASVSGFVYGVDNAIAWMKTVLTKEQTTEDKIGDISTALTAILGE